MRSDNLKRHAESCNRSQVASTSPSLEGRVSTGNKRAIPSAIISGSGKSDEPDHHPSNQKIQKLVNEIVNYDVTSPSASAEVSSPL